MYVDAQGLSILQLRLEDVDVKKLNELSAARAGNKTETIRRALRLLHYLEIENSHCDVLLRERDTKEIEKLRFV